MLLMLQGLGVGPNWSQQLNGRANGFHAPSRGVPPRSGSTPMPNGAPHSSQKAFSITATFTERTPE